MPPAPAASSFPPAAPGLSRGLAGAFMPMTSELDWCEPNYQITPHVAELLNTLSNWPFFVYPPIIGWLFRDYAVCVTSFCHVVWALLVVVGIGSTYFHATLSLAGQLLDEFAILWVFNAALAVWMPRQFMPRMFKSSLRLFQLAMLVVTVAGTLLCCVYPKVNAYVLICFGAPVMLMLVNLIKRCETSDVRALGMRCLLLWSVAVTIWLTDRLHCPFWLNVGFPYLHSVWHVLAFHSCYQACVLFAYFDTQTQYKELKPHVTYWPRETMTWVGLPVLTLRARQVIPPPRRPCSLC